MTVRYARLRALRVCTSYDYSYSRPVRRYRPNIDPAPVVRAGVVASRKVRA